MSVPPAPDVQRWTLDATLLRGVLRVIALVVGLVFAFALLPMRGAHAWVGAIAGFVLVLLVFPIAVRRARAILRSERPLLDAIEAIALLSTLLVLGFAAVYYAVAHDSQQFIGLRTRLDSVYFTVTTISTVGFGDVQASGQLARALVVGQIIIDFVFIGLAIRVLAAAARHRVGQARANPSAADGSS